MHSLGAEMSHKRSGLLSGLFFGLLAALICAAGLGVAVLYQESLPKAVTGFGGGVPVSLALALLIAVIVALAMGARRPRSLLLLPFAFLYGGAAFAGGQITGLSVLLGARARAPEERAGLSDVDLPTFNEGLPQALRLYRELLTETTAWLYIVVAALAALALLTLRVLRVRRARSAGSAGSPDEPGDSGEPGAPGDSGKPEYRAPFEPAQPPAPKPTTDLFTPRKPARD